MNTLFKTLASTNVPTQLTGTATLFQTADIFAVKSFSISGYPVYNTNPIYLGLGSGQAYQQIPTGINALRVGALTSLPRNNLADYWMLGQNGDGLYVVFN